jgi:hypothetical protein
MPWFLASVMSRFQRVGYPTTQRNSNNGGGPWGLWFLPLVDNLLTGMRQRT